MSYPKAYQPVRGYKYQILCRHPEYNGREWEHCDYAIDKKEKNYMVSEYTLAYGCGYEFKAILLPQKYWSEEVV